MEVQGLRPLLNVQGKRSARDWQRFCLEAEVQRSYGEVQEAFGKKERHCWEAVEFCGEVKVQMPRGWRPFWERKRSGWEGQRQRLWGEV